MKILEELRNTSSRISKEEILRKATFLDLTVFKLTYDQNLTYGIKFPDSEIDLDNIGYLNATILSTVNLNGPAFLSANRNPNCLISAASKGSTSRSVLPR